MHKFVEIEAAPWIPEQGLHGGQADTPVGPAWLLWDKVGLRQMAFGVVLDDVADALAVRDDQAAAELTHAAFNQTDLDMPLVLSGTEFQRAVWRALLQIEIGQMTTYGALAASLGKPNAARAVGAAVGANRLGFCVPCHRVLPQNGSIGGFRWGPEVKRRLLDWETRWGHG